MGARRVEDLTVWQVADELRRKVHERSLEGSCTRDFRFVDQLRDASSSVTRKIAEGFGRYRHKEFANFLGIARGSAFELMDVLRDGVSRHHWTPEQIADLVSLTNRTIAGLTSLMRYLQHHPTP
jgi:four helix bundle protein